MENTAHHNSVYGETRHSQLTIFFNTKSNQGEEKSNIISKRKHKNTYTNHIVRTSFNTHTNQMIQTRWLFHYNKHETPTKAKNRLHWNLTKSKAK